MTCLAAWAAMRPKSGFSIDRPARTDPGAVGGLAGRELELRPVRSLPGHPLPRRRQRQQTALCHRVQRQHRFRPAGAVAAPEGHGCQPGGEQPHRQAVSCRGGRPRQRLHRRTAHRRHLLPCGPVSEPVTDIGRRRLLQAGVAAGLSPLLPAIARAAAIDLTRIRCLFQEDENFKKLADPLYISTSVALKNATNM